MKIPGYGRLITIVSHFRGIQLNPGDAQLLLLRTALDASSEGLLVIDLSDQQIIECNSPFSKLWNLPSVACTGDAAKLIELLSHQLVNRDQADLLIQNPTSARSNSPDIFMELKSGKVLKFRSRCLPEDGKAKWRFLFFQDVTPELQTALQKQRELFERKQAFLDEILSSLPSLISYVSRDYRYLYLNSTYEQWWGISAKDYIGRPVQDLVGEKQFQLYKPFMDSALSGKPLSFGAQVPYRAVGSKATEINYIPHISKDGEVEGVFVIVHDISELKKTEHELLQKEQLLDQILENIPSALCLKDVDDQFKIKLWNKSAERIFGIPRDLVLGKRACDIWSPESTASQTQLEQRLIEENRISETLNVMGLTADNKRVPLNITHIPIRYPGSSKVQHILNVCTDMTKEREAQRISVQSAKMSSLGEMASGMAHEINNPLAVIQILAESLKNKIENGTFTATELIESISKIEKHSGRIAKIIKNLRIFSRNSEADPMQVVSFKQIFDDTIELCQERFKYQKIEIRTNIDSEIRLECRASQISQVLMNLLNNAYDAVSSLPEKWIDIQLTEEQDRVTFSITDSGPGIPLSLQEKIMQPFFTTKEVGKGTGLGLSISKGIIEDHQGEFYYDEKSKRTRFIVKLPLRQKTAKDENPG
jgi:PAS domain S-box-containing protein